MSVKVSSRTYFTFFLHQRSHADAFGLVSTFWNAQVTTRVARLGDYFPQILFLSWQIVRTTKATIKALSRVWEKLCNQYARSLLMAQKKRIFVYVL